jgi:hypothetical protein
MDGAFSPDGRTLAVAACGPLPDGGTGGTIYVWDAAARRLTATLSTGARQHRGDEVGLPESHARRAILMLRMSCSHTWLRCW